MQLYQKEIALDSLDARISFTGYKAAEIIGAVYNRGFAVPRLLTNFKSNNEGTSTKLTPPELQRMQYTEVNLVTKLGSKGCFHFIPTDTANKGEGFPYLLQGQFSYDDFSAYRGKSPQFIIYRSAENEHAKGEGDLILEIAGYSQERVDEAIFQIKKTLGVKPDEQPKGDQRPAVKNGTFPGYMVRDVRDVGVDTLHISPEAVQDLYDYNINTLGELSRKPRHEIEEIVGRAQTQKITTILKEIGIGFEGSHQTFC